MTGSGGDELAAGCDDDDDGARQALLAIYQAGKPDMMFQTRAPSTAALERMLVAMTDVRVRGSTNKCAPPAAVLGQSQRRDAAAARRTYTGRPATGRDDDVSDDVTHDVSDDVTPVTVKVECPPRSDTVVSFRVTSKAT